MEILSRRGFFAAAGAILAARPALASEFWKKKDPADWTSDEIGVMLTKSPWAKEVTAQFVPGEEGGGYGRQGGGYPQGGGGGPMGGPRVGVGIPGIGMPRRRGGGGYPGGRGGGRGTGSTYKGTIRWESAQPVLMASKTTLSEDFADQYVIHVIGIPLLNTREQSSDDDHRRDDDRLDNLKHLATLSTNTRGMTDAQLVKRAGDGFLFGFPKKELSLSNDDKEIHFGAQLGRLMVKAKFIPKDMQFRKKLAV